MKPTLDSILGAPSGNPVSERTQASLDRVGQFIADITTVAREHNRLDSEFTRMRAERDRWRATAERLEAEAQRTKSLLAWAESTTRIRPIIQTLPPGFAHSATEYGQAGGSPQRAVYLTVHVGPVLYQPSDDVELADDSFFIEEHWHTPDDDTAVFVLYPLPPQDNK